MYHICLIGLETYTDSNTEKFKTNNNDAAILNIKEYHERILMFLVEEFLEKGFKYISFLPGGFE